MFVKIIKIALEQALKIRRHTGFANTFWISLTTLTKNVLETGLNLLGIEVQKRCKRCRRCLLSDVTIDRTC